MRYTKWKKEKVEKRHRHPSLELMRNVTSYGVTKEGEMEERGDREPAAFLFSRTRGNG